MVILVLAGLWALLLGRIRITSGLSLEGRRARWYGLALLVAAPIYGIVGGLAAGVIASVAPTMAGNEVLGMVARAAVLVAIIVGLVPLFRDKPAGTVVAVHKS
jgi:hypothetical protein